MTKLDGDARGGAALSIKAVTGKRSSSWVWVKTWSRSKSSDRKARKSNHGIWRHCGLDARLEKVVDEEKAEEDAKKMLSGNFDMWDFLEQIRVIKQMGSLGDIFEKMPFFGGGLPDGAQIDESALVRIESIIQSMTKSERKDPELVESESRRAERIANGSGRKPQEVIELIGRFKGMRQVMGAIGSPGGGNMLMKLPGFKQFAQMQSQGMDMNEVMGQFGVDGGMGGMGMPGMGGMPGLGGPQMAGPKPGASAHAARNTRRRTKSSARRRRQRRLEKKK